MPQLTFQSLTHDEQELYWKTALQAALEEAQVPEGTITKVQFSTIVTSLVISRQLESEEHLLAVIAAGKEAKPSVILPKAELTVAALPPPPKVFPRIGVAPRFVSIEQ